MSEQMRSIKQDGDAAQQLKEEMTNTNPFDDLPVEYFDDGVRFGTGSEMITEIKRLREVCENWGNNYQSWVDANKKLEAENHALTDRAEALLNKCVFVAKKLDELNVIFKDTVEKYKNDHRPRSKKEIKMIRDISDLLDPLIVGLRTEKAVLSEEGTGDDRNTTPPAHAGGSRASEHKRA